MDVPILSMSGFRSCSRTVPVPRGHTRRPYGAYRHIGRAVTIAPASSRYAQKLCAQANYHLCLDWDI